MARNCDQCPECTPNCVLGHGCVANEQVSDDWITEHFEVGKINVGWETALVLACRYCGAFVWDTRKHMAALHESLVGNVRRNLPPSIRGGDDRG